MTIDGSRTTVMLGRQHGDRWSAYGEHAGIREISSLLKAEELKQFDILREFDEEFLRGISADVTLATWNPGAVIFEAGAYLDLAFLVVQGEVEMVLAPINAAHKPIFTAKVQPRISPAPSSAKTRPEGSIVFLAAADFNLTPGDVLRLGAGELFGEISAMNGWPQSVTARTSGACTLLQIRVPALRKIRNKSKSLKKRLDEAYRLRTLRQHLTSTPLLEGCPSEVIERLAARVEFVSCEPGDVVAAEGDAVEHLVLVRSGALKLSQTLGDGQIAVAYVAKGGTVGESELLSGDDGVWNVTATSVGYSELMRIPKTDVLDVMRVHKDLEQRLWAVASDRLKAISARRNNLARVDLLEFTLAKGLGQANSVLVIDLDKCTRCDDCVRACASTHGGTPRFVREGDVYDGFMVTRSCYHCQDPTCLVGCPTGAIARLNVGDTVAIDADICIGCGACAENCRYDAIVMHDLQINWGPDALPKQLRGQPREQASKCDLCYTAPQGPACVSSCPHGAAHRVSGAEQFDVLLESRRRGASAR